MTRYSTISLRYISVLLITLLLLVQTALVPHEIEHAVGGDNDHCVSCLVANHQNGYTTESFQLELAQFSDFFIKSSAIILLFTHIINYYTSRAPPVSNFN